MKEFKRYSHKQFKLLLLHLKEYRSNQNSDTLHKIRVDVKRIKSVLLMVKYSTKKFKAHKSFIPFRTIFRKAGEIRDPEVHAGLLLRFNIVGVKKLGSENKSIAAFLKNLRSWERKVKSHVKKIKPFINRVSKKDLKEFIDERRAEIKAKLHPQPHMDEIHKVRKAMKMVIYLAEVDDCVKTKTVSFYRELEEAIGDLHDKQVLLGLLSNHGKQEGDADRKIILTECRTSTDTIKKISRKFYKG